MARTVQCIKLGKEAEGLDFAPYPGELGKRIWESVSKEAWAAWLKHQTMLVNENRLNLADARARQDRGGFVERLVQRGLAAAEVVIIHGGQIVMDQRIGVDEFNRRRCFNR